MLVWARALLHTYIGDVEGAIDQLELLMSIPNEWPMAEFRLDPRFDPLHDHPRFQALLEKYADEVVH